VAYAEFFAALNRKYREAALTQEAYQIAIEEFKADWASIAEIEVTGHLRRCIEDVTSRYALRGFDAIHLASALYVREFEPEHLCFVCADNRLNAAAQAEGLHVSDVS